MGFIMFTVDYSCLFWGETRVPSGLTAVMMATIPLILTAEELFILRRGSLSKRLVLGLAAVAAITGARRAEPPPEPA